MIKIKPKALVSGLLILCSPFAGRIFFEDERYKTIFLSPGFLISCSVVASSQAKRSSPQLITVNGITQLQVKGKPFLGLGGELGNSSASSIDYLQRIRAKLKLINLNTVLAPVHWELMELAEGQFDFTLVDSMIAGARKQDLKLVLLWFASWKNSMSCYAPAWIKTNEQKFERAGDRKGNGMEILSAF